MDELPLAAVGDVEVGADGEHLGERPRVGVGGRAVQRRQVARALLRRARHPHRVLGPRLQNWTYGIGGRVLLKGGPQVA